MVYITDLPNSKEAKPTTFHKKQKNKAIAKMCEYRSSKHKGISIVIVNMYVKLLISM